MLADRLQRGALPLDQVLRYGIEMTDALGWAHSHGIVHRDLKPSNVMVAKSGIKLLDFGLATFPTSAEQQDVENGASDKTETVQLTARARWFAPFPTWLLRS